MDAAAFPHGQLVVVDTLKHQNSHVELNILRKAFLNHPTKHPYGLNKYLKVWITNSLFIGLIH